MKSLAALYPSQYRKYVKNWKQCYEQKTLKNLSRAGFFVRLAQYAVLLSED